MAALLLIGAVGDQHGSAHRQAGAVDEQWRLGTRHLLLEDDLLDERRAAPTVFFRPRHTAPAGVVQQALPALAVGDPLVHALWLGARRIVLEPRAQLGTEALLFRGIREVHARLLATNAVKGKTAVCAVGLYLNERRANDMSLRH